MFPSVFFVHGKPGSPGPAIVCSRLETARAGFTGGRRVSVTGAAAAAFTDVTLVEKDGQPPAANSVILRAVRPYSEIF